MTKLLITGGLVAVEDGRKPAEDYAPARKARVELSFDVAEGQDANDVVGLVGEIASARVAELIGGVVTTARRTEGDAQLQQPRPRRASPKRAEKPAPEPEAGTDTSSDTSEPEAPSGEDDWDAPIAPAVVETISDADLNAAVQKRNGELNDAPRIRKLIGEFNPDPAKQFTLKEIAPERRREFLDKLAALS